MGKSARILIVGLVLFMVPKLGHTQERTVKFDAQRDALLLTEQNAKIVGDLTPNQAYTISVAEQNVSAPMHGVFLAIQEPHGKRFTYLESGHSLTFVPVDNSPQLAVFYVDWSTASDNSGTLTVDIVGPTSKTLTIDAKTDAILLDSVTTVVGHLTPSQPYTVAVQDSALSGYLCDGLYFMYQNDQGKFSFKYVPTGSAFVFKPSSYLPYQLAPLYVDWSTTADNNGSVAVRIRKTDPPMRKIIIDAQADALLLSEENAKIVGDLTPNQAYTISVAEQNVSAPMHGVFLAIQEPHGKRFTYLESGHSLTFVPVDNSPQLAVFYVDWSTASDNSGTLTVDIVGPTSKTLTIDAKTDAILLDSVTTVVGHLTPSQPYTVAVQDSALSGYLCDGLYFMYQNDQGKFSFKYVPTGSAFVFKPSSYLPYQLAPLYVDWSTTADNNGSVQVQISPLYKASGVQTIPETPHDFCVYQNYPNPFNPTTTIRFSIAKREHVQVKVYDIRGSLVSALLDASLAAGEHRLIFDGSGLTSGTYLLVVRAEGKTEIRRMLLVR